MEYYIVVTKSCNLSCSYCSGVNISKLTSRDRITRPSNAQENIEKLIKDIKEHRQDNNIIVFYGGEPLLNQSDIELTINGVSSAISPNVAYAMYTNGILLDQISSFLLKNLDYLFVSIDGTEDMHDFHRGKGTYKHAISNFVKIKDRFSGETMGRTTVTSRTDLATCIFANLELFDHVYWSLDNTNIVPADKTRLVTSYIESINVLMEYWMGSIRSGVVPNIVPFQALTNSLLGNETYALPRCGCGTKLKVMDLDGSFYMCDELIGQKRFLVNGYFPHLGDVRQRCRECEYESLCGGRCVVALLFHSDDKFDLDCQMTKALIGLVEKNVPEIRSLLANGVIKRNDISTYVSQNCTEQIP